MVASPVQPLFVHIPKNAGSTIAELFRRNGYAVGQYDERLKLKTKRSCSAWHIPPIQNPAIRFSKQPTFMIVRNPIDRIVSQYNYVSDKDSLKYGKNINFYIQHALLSSKKTFDDCHFIPQYEYLYDAHGSKVENILRFENLRDDFNSFSDAHQLGFRMGPNDHRNKKKRGATRDDLWYETIRLIETVYRRDFIVFKYPIMT